MIHAYLKLCCNNVVSVNAHICTTLVYVCIYYSTGILYIMCAVVQVGTYLSQEMGQMYPRHWDIYIPEVGQICPVENLRVKVFPHNIMFV